jgi:hypothetical protein
VLGNETNPTPLDDGKPVKPAKLTDQLQSAIASWEICHALAREALLKALEPSDLIRVIPHQHSASAIWNRLKQEYGRPLDFEYIRANNEYQSL